MAGKQHAIVIGLEVAGYQDDVANVSGWLQSLGITDIRTLLDNDATFNRITSAIRDASNFLTSSDPDKDDLLVIYYSGHGGQIPGKIPEETDADGKSQVMFAKDGKIRDSDLWDLWTQFALDVRIVLITDSCHSEGLAGTFSSRTVRASLVHMSACSNDEESRGAAGRGGRFTNAMRNTHSQARNYLEWCHLINNEVFKSVSSQLSHCNSYGAHRKTLVGQKPLDLNAPRLKPGLFDF